MSDWDAFIDSVPWFLKRGHTAEVSDRRKMPALSDAVATLFPSLAKLFAKAAVTDVSIDNARYELLAWDSVNGDRFGWLCLPPTARPLPNIHDDHKKLLLFFGGIVERFHEPEDTWLLNLNDALTEREAVHDGSFIQQYKWAIDKAGLKLPIEPTKFYSIAREANGNDTLCHRISGQVLMFAPDHSFDHLTELQGCPEYSLYTINGAATFCEWVEAVAAQWLVHTVRAA